MSITLRTLLDDPSLALKNLGSAAKTLDSAIAWVAVTELENPQPFLSGAELVLTTGARLNTAAAQRVFVRQVQRSGAVGIGFGTGLGHDSVPQALLAEANRWAVPVLEIPYQTPFLAIGKLVADALSTEHYAKLEGLLAAHQLLVQSLLSSSAGNGGGLASLLGTLRTMVGADVVLEQFHAQIFSSTPGSVPDDDHWLPVPVPTGKRDACTLWLRKPFRDNGVVDYAKSLVSVELANQVQRRQDSRQLAGQVLQDVLRGALPEADIAARLRGVQIDPSAKNLILLVTAPERKRSVLAGMVLPPAFDAGIAAVVEDELLVVLPASGLNAVSLAGKLSRYLHGAGIPASVGIGGAYAQANGLRWSYFEAREAAGRGLEVNEPERLSLTSLLLASEDVPMADMATETLGPLVQFDAEHGSELMLTLESYLQLNGSLAAVADSLSLHRNTVRYRLTQIAELTGFDPATTADRVQLWLALSVRRLS
ncbi:purine catabolism regulator [Psychromicrobium silvestre]|uniref:Purine catabolism regulator n=1 Tax=Psychromicrobium silvestre TaxID=1645614 RepID=A0A7Y9S7X6_9MICC|nr:PucR family transcriptional regulator [Psychromicrobium silvestre]NYE95436.1 purine catabolism regulator [Psychromicrobium silvestre]